MDTSPLARLPPDGPRNNAPPDGPRGVLQPPSRLRGPSLSSKRTYQIPARSNTGSPSAMVPSPSSPIPPSTERKAKDDKTKHFVQSVIDLAGAAVTAANLGADGRRLQKRIDTNDGLLNRAKAHPSFPTTSALYQQMRNGEAAEKARIDEELKANSLAFDRFADDLKSFLEPVTHHPSPTNQSEFKSLASGIESKTKQMLNSAQSGVDTKLNNFRSDVQFQMNLEKQTASAAFNNLRNDVQHQLNTAKQTASTTQHLSGSVSGSVSGSGDSGSGGSGSGDSGGLTPGELSHQIRAEIYNARINDLHPQLLIQIHGKVQSGVDTKLKNLRAELLDKIKAESPAKKAEIQNLVRHEVHNAGQSGSDTKLKNLRHELLSRTSSEIASARGFQPEMRLSQRDLEFVKKRLESQFEEEQIKGQLRFQAMFDNKMNEMRTELMSKYDAENGALRAELFERKVQIDTLQEGIDQLLEELDGDRGTHQKAHANKEHVNSEGTELQPVDEQLLKKIPILNERIEKLEKVLDSHSTSIDTLFKSNKGFEDKFSLAASSSSQMKGSAASVDSINAELGNKLSALKEDLSEYRRSSGGKFGQLDAAIGKQDGKAQLVDDLSEKVVRLEKSLEKTTSSLNTAYKTVNTRLVAQEGRNKRDPGNGGTDLNVKVRDVEDRLNSLESNRSEISSKGDRWHELDGRVSTLADQVKGICEMQAMKDDFQLSSMEEVKESLSQHKVKTIEGLATVASNSDRALANCNRISEEVKALKPTTSMAASTDIAGQATRIQRLSQLVEVIKVSLQSLEGRYNGLTTEPIVKNMVAAMQEMYPSAGALVEQVTQLKNHVDALVPADIKPRMNMMLDNITRLNHNFRAVCEKMDKSNTSGVPELGQLRATVFDTMRKLDSLARETEHQDKSKKAEHEALLENLNGERDRLSNQVSALSDELKSLVDDVMQSKIARGEDSKEFSKRISSAFGRITQLEKTVNSLSRLRRHDIESGRATSPMSLKAEPSSLESDSEAEAQPQRELESFPGQDQRASVVIRKELNNKRKRPLSSRGPSGEAAEDGQSSQGTVSLHFQLLAALEPLVFQITNEFFFFFFFFLLQRRKHDLPKPTLKEKRRRSIPAHPVLLLMTIKVAR